MNIVAVSRFDGDAYKSSQTAELTLNVAILRRLVLESMSFRQAPESNRCETVCSRTRASPTKKRLSTNKFRITGSWQKTGNVSSEQRINLVKLLRPTNLRGGVRDLM